MALKAGGVARLRIRPGSVRAIAAHQLQLVDITGQAELMQRYGERIPVLVIGDREYAAPLPVAALERALRDAARGTEA